MTDLKVGDELEIPMGLGFKMRVEITDLDPATQTGGMKVLGVIIPPKPRYVRGHKPQPSNFGLTCADCGGELVKLTTSLAGTIGLLGYRHKARPREPLHDNNRYFCSVCGKPGKPYEFEPGSGKCVDCQN